MASVHGNAGPPPDLSARFKLKAKYAELQRKYNRALEVRKDLTLEAAEKESKVERLQDEVNLVLDQIYATDYKHLLPANDSLFSDDSDDHAASGDDESDADDAAAAELDASANGNGNGNGNGSAPLRADAMINGTGYGNGHGAENGRVRKERPEDSPIAAGGPSADERAPKRARVEGETTPLPPTAVPNHETAAALRVMLSPAVHAPSDSPSMSAPTTGAPAAPSAPMNGAPGP